MMIQKLRFANTLILIFLAGCSSLAPILSTPTSAPAPAATSTLRPEPTATSSPAVTSTTLVIWLPPRFDPSAETESAELLDQRLREFEAEHSDLNIEVRIKSNPVEFLRVTTSAAPDSMPDLVVLSYNEMQAAAAAGYLHPLDGLTEILQDPDWYVFARDLSSVQNAGYGIPFAANALLTVYRPAVFDTPPATWDAIIGSGAKIVFPASDPNTYFPLSLYLSLGGQLADEQGAFTLDETILARVLSFYQSAYEAEAIPVSSRVYQSDEQTLIGYRNGEADLAVVWASSDIATVSGEYASLPGLEDVPHAIGNGWVWAFAGSDPEIQPLAVELASYLVESDYMAEWTYAARYLPTRPLALEAWEGEALKSGINDVLLSAHPAPSPETISRFGSLMQGALTRIFNGDQAEAVARSVVESIE
ncbi:MAG TPA: extracellular solute-binding protein [Anaerolineales bacterium]|nr:extracellular solute-binding protein [Anaerolineales bacterium]